MRFFRKAVVAKAPEQKSLPDREAPSSSTPDIRPGAAAALPHLSGEAVPSQQRLVFGKVSAGSAARMAEEANRTEPGRKAPSAGFSLRGQGGVISTRFPRSGE